MIHRLRRAIGLCVAMLFMTAIAHAAPVDFLKLEYGNVSKTYKEEATAVGGDKAWTNAFADILSYCEQCGEEEAHVTLTLMKAMTVNGKTGPVHPVELTQSNLYLTITTTMKNGTYTQFNINGAAPSENTKAFLYIKGAHVTLENGTLCLKRLTGNNRSIPVVQVADGGVFTMNGGKLTNENNLSVGIQTMGTGKAFINGGTISAPRSILYGNAQSEVLIHKGTIESQASTASTISTPSWAKASKVKGMKRAAASSSSSSSSSSKQFSYEQNESEIPGTEHSFNDVLENGQAYYYKVNGLTYTKSRAKLVGTVSNKQTFLLDACSNHNDQNISPIMNGEEIDPEYHLAGCSNCYDVQKLKHSWRYTFDPDYTCTTPGRRIDECECGARREVVLPAAHRLETVSGYEATCVAPGMTDYIVCTACGEVIQQSEVIPQLSHSFTNYVKSETASCIDGYTYEAVCDYGCGATDTYTDASHSSNPPLYDSHDWDEGTLNDDATCWHTATITHHCKREGCNATKKVYSPGKTTIKHNMVVVNQKANSCDEDGTYEYHYCSNPGCDYAWSEYPVAVDGMYGEWLKRNSVIPAKGHNYSLKVESEEALVQAANCRHPNRYRYTCRNCGELEPIEASTHGNDHYFEVGGVLQHDLHVTSYTTDEDYLRTWYNNTFSNFQDYEYKHDYSNANCILECSREDCGYYTEVMVNSAMHQLVGVEELKAPTCQPGWGRYNYRFLGGDTGFWRWFQGTEFSFENYIAPAMNEDGTFKTHAYEEAADGTSFCPYHETAPAAMKLSYNGQRWNDTKGEWESGDYVAYCNTLDQVSEKLQSATNEKVATLEFYQDVDCKNGDGEWIDEISLGCDIDILLNGHTINGRFVNDEGEDACSKFVTSSYYNVSFHNGTLNMNFNLYLGNQQTLLLDNVKVTNTNVWPGTVLSDGLLRLTNGSYLEAANQLCFGNIELDATSTVRGNDLEKFGGYEQYTYDDEGNTTDNYHPLQMAIHYADASQYFLKEGELVGYDCYAIAEDGTQQKATYIELSGAKKSEHDYSLSQDIVESKVSKGHRSVCSTCYRLDPKGKLQPHTMDAEGIACTKCNLRYRVVDQDGRRYISLGNAMEVNCDNDEVEEFRFTLLCNHDNDYNSQYAHSIYFKKPMTFDLAGYDFNDELRRLFEDNYTQHIINSGERRATLGRLELRSMNNSYESSLHLGGNITIGQLYSDDIPVIEALRTSKVNLDACLEEKDYDLNATTLSNVVLNNPSHSRKGAYAYNNEENRYELPCYYCGKLLDTVEKNELGEFRKDAITLYDNVACAYEYPLQVNNLTIMRQLPAAMVWQSLYLPVRIPVSNITEAGLEVATINQFHQTDSNDDGVIDVWYLEVHPVKEADAVLRANTPYVIRSKNDVNATNGQYPILMENATIEATTERSLKLSNPDYKYTFTGNYQNLSNLSNMWCVDAEGVLSETLSLTPQHWMLNIKKNATDENQEQNNVRIFILSFDEEGNPTDISTPGQKGRTITSIYSVDGKKLNSLQQGINILQLEDGTIQKFIKKTR